MKNPESVKIGPLDWRIHYSEKLNNDDLGNTTLEDITITLYRHRPISSLRETLMHEILHAILATYSLSPAILSTDRKKNDLEDMEETLVGLLSVPLLLVLRDNPEVALWLMSEE